MNSKKILNLCFGAIFITIFLGLSQTLSGQEPKLNVSSIEQVTESVKKVPCPRKDRLDGVKSLFKEMGASEEDIKIEENKKGNVKNLTVKKQGKSDETIIIGAHFDRSGFGCGAIDNWSGIAILVHLFKTLKDLESEKSYIFIAFDKEEDGRVGSAAFAQSIHAERRQKVCSMVNFDSFGFSAPWVLSNVSNKKLTELAEAVAKESEFEMEAAEIETSNADSTSFNDIGIAAITFSGLDKKGISYIHTDQDQLKKINMSSVFFGYKFGLLFVARLDSSACDQFANTRKSRI